MTPRPGRVPSERFHPSAAMYVQGRITRDQVREVIHELRRHPDQTKVELLARALEGLVERGQENSH